MQVSEDVFRSVTKAHEGASFCQVFENVWIGNIGAAWRAANGMLNEFAAVFNASGLESRGITLERQLVARGIAYDSLMDDVTGITLRDGPLGMTVAEAAADLVTARSAIVERDGKAIAVMGKTIATRPIFNYFMIRAQEKIANVLTTIGPSKKLLVHCSGGINRAAASIVAYLVLGRKMESETAIELVVTANRQKRRVEVLTTKDFAEALRDLVPYSRSERAEVRVEYDKHVKKLFAAMTKMRKEKKAEAATATTANADAPPTEIGCEMSEAVLASGGGGEWKCAACGAADDPPAHASAYCSSWCQRQSQRH